MKKIILPVILLLCISCTKHINTFSNPNPEKFVEEIKAGTYTLKGPNGFVEIPDFTRDDIAVLIKYVTDLRNIKFYPISPVSSIAYPDRYLGESLLWTIEGIMTGSK